MIEIIPLSPSDADIALRDEKVKEKLLNALQDAHAQIQESSALLAVVRTAVDQQSWWELGGILTAEEIECLCQTSPLGLLDSLED
jgi:hypothetical protein